MSAWEYFQKSGIVTGGKYGSHQVHALTFSVNAPLLVRRKLFAIFALNTNKLLDVQVKIPGMMSSWWILTHSSTSFVGGKVQRTTTFTLDLCKVSC